MTHHTDPLEIDTVEVPEATPGYRLALVYRLLSDIKRRHSLQSVDSSDEASLLGNRPEPTDASRSLEMRGGHNAENEELVTKIGNRKPEVQRVL
jgi:hypothetical protein